MRTRWELGSLELRLKTRVAIGLLVVAASLLASPDHGRNEPAGSLTERQLNAMLSDFLTAANTGDKAVFKSFFAADVIYTSSKAEVLHKSDIMKSLNEPPPADASKTIYDHADTIVCSFGDNLAIANFQLIRRITRNGKSETKLFRNTGTFLKNNRRWQVIAWQSTPVTDAANLGDGAKSTCK